MNSPELTKIKDLIHKYIGGLARDYGYCSCKKKHKDLHMDICNDLEKIEPPLIKELEAVIVEQEKKHQEIRDNWIMACQTKEERIKELEKENRKLVNHNYYKTKKEIDVGYGISMHYRKKIKKLEREIERLKVPVVLSEKEFSNLKNKVIVKSSKRLKK